MDTWERARSRGRERELSAKCTVFRIIKWISVRQHKSECSARQVCMHSGKQAAENILKRWIFELIRTVVRVSCMLYSTLVRLTGEWSAFNVCYRCCARPLSFSFAFISLRMYYYYRRCWDHSIYSLSCTYTHEQNSKQSFRARIYVFDLIILNKKVRSFFSFRYVQSQRIAIAHIITKLVV